MVVVMVVVDTGTLLTPFEGFAELAAVARLPSSVALPHCRTALSPCGACTLNSSS
jgi:hypothetical protein